MHTWLNAVYIQIMLLCLYIYKSDCTWIIKIQSCDETIHMYYTVRTYTMQLQNECTHKNAAYKILHHLQGSIQKLSIEGNVLFLGTPEIEHQFVYSGEFYIQRGKPSKKPQLLYFSIIMIFPLYTCLYSYTRFVIITLVTILNQKTDRKWVEHREKRYYNGGMRSLFNCECVPVLLTSQ